MNVIVDKDKLDALADAIGIKSKVRLPLTIDEQIEAVNLIETDPKLQDKQVTLTPKATAQTKTVTVDEGYDGLNEVSINVRETPLQNINYGNVGAPGLFTFTPSAPNIGLSQVSLNVPVGSSGNTSTSAAFYTSSGTRKWHIRHSVAVSGYYSSGASVTSAYSNYTALPTGTTVTPSSTAQTIGGANVMMEGAITVEAVPSGSLSNQAWSRTKGSTHMGVTHVVKKTEGYISSGTQSFNNSTMFALETKTATPSATSQTITPTGESYYLNEVIVNPIPSEYIIPSGTKQITANGTGIDVTQYAEVDVAVPSSQPNLQTKTKSYTPSETAQSETVSADAGYDGLDEVSVSVGAISSTYVGSGITRRDSSDLTASGATVTAPAGYYAQAASKAVSSGTEGTPTATKGTVSNHAVTVTPSVTNGAGYISGGTHTGTGVSVSASELVSGTYVVDSSGTKDVTNYASASVPAGTAGSPALSVSAVEDHAKTIRSSVINQTGWITGGTVSGASTRVSASDLVSGTLNVTSSGTKDVTNYASASVPAGTAGTPTATKGTVSNHAISVTPSVTNQTGFITGSTINGTAVTVSASELVSGNKAITQNGSDIDVTNFATVSVNVEGGGGGMTVATATKTLASAASSIQFTGLSGAPTSFVITASTNQSTGGTKAVAVVYDGTSCHGMDLTSQAVADTGFSQSYSGDTLTVTATTASFQATEYKLVYTYGGTSANIGTANVQVGSGATSITFTGLTDEPDYFSCIFKSSFSTSSGYQRVMELVYDGTNIYGFALDSSAHALTSWSYTYNSGSLTISSASTSNGGYFHQPGDYQLTYGYGGTVTPVEIEVEPLSVTQNGTYTAPTGKAYTPVTVNVSGGGSVQYDTKTATASDYPVSLAFTNMKGEPKAFVLRLNAQVSSSGSTTYYYIVDVAHFGTTTHGNCFRIGSTRRVDNITSGYSYTYSNSTLTITSSASSRSASPGAFYNGSYELLYAY